MAKFAAVIRFVPDTERRLKVRPTHRKYLQALLDRGKLYESGPWTDDQGALLIYEVADEAEARELLANDPYTEHGIIAEASVHGWNVVFSSNAKQ